MHKSLFWTWIAIFLFPLPLVIQFNEIIITTNANVLYYNTGIVAYCWWLVSTFLAMRPRWLVQKISLPKLYSIHGILGVGAFALAFLHSNNLFSMGFLIKLTGKWALYIAAFSLAYAVFFLSGWLVDHFKWAYRLKNQLSPFFRHQVSVWIHRLNLVMILLIWLHVHLIGRINTNLSFMLIFDSYSFIVIGWYLWNLCFPKLKEAVVIDNEKINFDTIKLVLQIKSKTIKYQAGDFYFLSSKVITDRHPFSVTGVPSDEQKVTFTIRLVGDDTKKLARLKTGDEVKLEGPYGYFAPTIDRFSGKSLILIGMGTGIAPLLSIAKKYQASYSLKVLWCVHKKEDLYYDSAFETMVGPGFSYYRQVGHFTEEQLISLIDEEQRKEALIIIAGPASGVLGIRKILRQNGVPYNHLLDERLTM